MAEGGRRGHATLVEPFRRIITNRGPALVVAIERDGLRLRDAAGSETFDEYRHASARPIGRHGVIPTHGSLVPWWDGLREDARENALFRQEVVLEIMTGYREGHAELAHPGEPFHPFGPDYGAPEAVRINAMSVQLSFERSVDRVVMRRVNAGEIRTNTIGRTTVYYWLAAWRRDGLRGLVDKRKARGRKGFEEVDPRYRRIAETVLAEFDGGVSAVNLSEIERRILVRVEQEGLTDAHLPQRLTQEFLSAQYNALGRTTRSHRSHAQRSVSAKSSYPAVHPSHLALDGTRCDNLVYDEVRERVFSVEILTLISVSTRVIVACRVTPRSSNGIEAGLALYDAMRPFSMLVKGTTIDDWRWTGVPESLDFSSRAVHVGRRPLVNAGPDLQGEHHIPGVRPSSIRSDHGSIFVGGHFRGLLRDFGIDLMLSRGSKPTDNPHVERWHETLQRAYQAIPGFKGRGVYERGRWVGIKADEPLLTAKELEQHLRRFIALDYHRTWHQGLVLAGAPEARLTPLEMFDAQLEATGRIHVPQHPDLIYQFLPIRWLTVRHAGVEYKNLGYDADILDDFRNVRTGTFRAQDHKVPFHYDPRDVTRLWFRHPESGRVHEIRWRAAHLVDAPMTDVVRDHALARIKARGGNRTLTARSTQRQIIAELTELTAPKDIDGFRSQLSAARLRWEQSRIDHSEVAEAWRQAGDRDTTGLRPEPDGIAERTPGRHEAPVEGYGFDDVWPDFDDPSK